MSDEKYDVVFRGQLAKGFSIDDAKKNIGALFKLPALKVEALFSGKRVVIKKNIDCEAASKYRVAIKKAGGLVEIIEREARTKASSQRKAVFNVGANDVSSREGSAKSPSAPAQGLVKKPVNEKTASTSISSGSIPVAASSGVNVESSKGHQSFELAAVGADVLRESERKVEEVSTIDLSAYSLSKTEGHLVESQELRRPEVKEVHLDESISLSEPGQNLVREGEIQREVPVAVNVTDISLAEPGAQLGLAKEEIKIDVKIDHLSLE